MMNLNDWLCENTNSVSSALIEINKKSLLDNRVLNYTAQAL